MKLYLASILQPENHGPGRLIGIADGHKPKDISIDLKYELFIPEAKYIRAYKNAVIMKEDSAPEEFCKNYPELGKKNPKSAFDILFNSEIGKIARIMEFSLKDSVVINSVNRDSICLPNSPFREPE